MARKETARSYALRRFEEGASGRQVWKELEEKFPHLICGWNYVMTIERAFKSMQRRAALPTD